MGIIEGIDCAKQDGLVNPCLRLEQHHGHGGVAQQIPIIGRAHHVPKFLVEGGTLDDEVRRRGFGGVQHALPCVAVPQSFALDPGKLGA